MQKCFINIISTHFDNSCFHFIMLMLSALDDFLTPYYLLPSLPSPFFLGLSVWRELVFVKSCFQGLFLQVMMLCLFTQRKIATVSSRWHADEATFFKNQSCTKCKFILLRTKNYWRLLGLNLNPRWKQFTNLLLYLWASQPWPL